MTFSFKILCTGPFSCQIISYLVQIEAVSFSCLGLHNFVGPPRSKTNNGRGVPCNVLIYKILNKVKSNLNKEALNISLVHFSLTSR